MMRYVVGVSLLLALAGGVADVCWADSQFDQIRAAIVVCPSPRKQDCVPEDELVVEVVKVVGDYALATIRRADGSGEGNGVYLKKSEGKWRILDEGTAMDPVALGVPDELWNDLPKQVR